MSLTGKQARHLRGLAHSLKPIILVGGAGVTEAVVAAADAALEFHELIKAKVDSDGRAEVREAADALAEGTGAAVAQIIGKTIVLYRARAKKPTIRLPSAG